MEETVKVGLLKGVTLNIGNYESARFDFWEERAVPLADKEKTIAEISQHIDSVIESEVTELDRQLKKAKK